MIVQGIVYLGGLVLSVGMLAYCVFLLVRDMKRGEW